MTKNSGIRCALDCQTPNHLRGSSALRLLLSLLLYAAIWGALGSMIDPDRSLLPGLAAGAALLLLMDLLRGCVRLFRMALAGAALLLLAYCCFYRKEVWDGLKLLVNQFFTASQNRQAYIYQMLPVSAGENGWTRCMSLALAPLGALGAVLCFCIVQRRMRSLALLFFLAFAGAAAYLGLSPAPGWTVLLTAALCLSTFDTCSSLYSAVTALALLGALSAAVLLLWPGEDSRLSAWEESARDQLAARTAAYAEHWEQAPEPVAQPEEEEVPYRREEALSDLGGELGVWGRRASFILLVAAVALILFVPSILSDWYRGRAAKRRAALEDPDASAAIRAMFRRSLEWLRLGGLKPVNAPASVYAAQAESLFSPEYGSRFRSVLPLWQEAAYSGHTMTVEQLREMRQFLDETKDLVWSGLSRWKRLLAKYYYVL